MLEKEVVVCAAVKFKYRTKEGTVITETIAGVRHHAILQSNRAVWIRTENSLLEREEGFLTNKYLEESREYRFIGRIGAKMMVKDYNQKVNNGDREECCDTNLYSEDLY